MATPEPVTAIVSAAVPVHKRAELERRAAENDRSLSSEIRRGLRTYLLATRDHEEHRDRA
jgi:hypothetical protein